MDVCRAHYVKGFAIWVGKEVFYGQFDTGFLFSVFSSFLDELRNESPEMIKGEIISRIKKEYEGSVTICDKQPTLCDTFQF